MKELIRLISKNGHSNENLDEVLKKHFQGLPLELVLLQKGKDEGVHSGQHPEVVGITIQIRSN